MRCHGFKGGIGTSSRLVASAAGTYVVGALVQANYGASPESSAPQDLRWLPHAQLDHFFEGSAEAVEEATLNALAAAETMTGFKGTAHALPLNELQAMMERYRV
jgi:L-aminopeptidase/D-esterase-like protein